MPEAEALPGAPPRITELPVLAGDQEYAPVAGLWELREAIAGYYNDLFRRGMGSKYSRRERRGLRRRSLGADPRRRVARQHQPRPLPAGLHGVRRAARASSVCSRRFRSCSSPSAATRSPAPICVARSSAAGSSAILASNPANPTGKVIGGSDLCRVGRGRSRARLRADLRRVLLALHLASRPRRARCDRDRRALRRGCRSRSGRDPRRPHEELALPGLARDVDGRAEEDHRRRVESRARSSTAAARGRSSARRSSCSRRPPRWPRPRDPQRVRQEAREAAQRPARPRLHRRSAARGHVLRVGVGAAPAGVDQRRHVRSSAPRSSAT